MPRYHAKKDKNHNEISNTLIQAGYSVRDLSAVGGGLCDILVGGIDRTTGKRANWILEIKTETGQLNPLQEDFHTSWRGAIAVVRTPDEALRAVGAVS